MFLHILNHQLEKDMKNFIFILTFLSQIAFAGDIEFLDQCENKDSLPSAEKATMESLIKIGSGIFTNNIKTCKDVLDVLKKSNHLEMRGGTFEYLFVESLKPIATLDFIKSLSIPNQKVSDFYILKQMELEKLNISSANFGGIDRLADLKSLEELIVTISTNDELQKLSTLPKLNKLTLAYNGSNDIRFNQIAGILSLKEITVTASRNVRLKDLESITNLKSLIIVSGIVDVRDLINLPLKNVELSNGGRTKIEFIDHLVFLTTLEHLSLREQNLDEIKFLKNLENLRSLNLSYNNIKSLDDIKMLTELEELDLSFNKIWRDNIVNKFVNLKKLDLYNNNIGFFDAQLLGNLESLNLGRNHIHTVTFDKHYKLKDLDLSYNQLRSPLNKTISIAHLPVVRTLDLSHNKITTLQDIGTLTTLNNLNLTDNKIMTTSKLYKLRNLTRLSARYNLLKKEDQFCPMVNKNSCDFLHQEI